MERTWSGSIAPLSSTCRRAEEHLVQHDGSNSARARSARIRTTHDYEATELDSMRRAGELARQQPPRASLRARVAGIFGRSPGWSAERAPVLDPAADVDVIIGGDV
jgi:hypothetical protein